MKRLLLAALIALAALPVAAERLVSTLSSPAVLITSSFDGATLSFFGNIEADGPDDVVEGPYHVITVITGPTQDRVARLKTNQFGIWTNTDAVSFRHFPSFYAVFASGKLENIAPAELLQEYVIRPEDQARQAAQTGGLKAERFGLELVRLMTEDGHLLLREDNVRFLSDTAFVVNVALPSDVANGPFIVHTFILKDKSLVAERTDAFAVRKSGFESFLFVMSRQQPLLYGLACVFLALGTGWLAGIVFRR